MRAVIAVLAFQAASGAIWAAETALDRYVAKPDASYSYQHYHTDFALGYRTYFIDMVSQQWRSPDEVDRTLWEHDVMITVPTLLDPGSAGTAHPMR